jgi:hypothetical protein
LYLLREYSSMAAQQKLHICIDISLNSIQSFWRSNFRHAELDILCGFNYENV